MKTMLDVVTWIKEHPGKSALEILNGSGYASCRSAQNMGQELRARQVMHGDVHIGGNNNRWYWRETLNVAPPRTFTWEPLRPVKSTLVMRPDALEYRKWPSAYD